MFKMVDKILHEVLYLNEHTVTAYKIFGFTYKCKIASGNSYKNAKLLSLVNLRYA